MLARASWLTLSPWKRTGSRRFLPLAAATCVVVGSAVALLAGFGPAAIDEPGSDANHRTASQAAAALADKALIATASAGADRSSRGNIAPAAFVLAAKAIVDGKPIADKPATVVASLSPEVQLPEPPVAPIAIPNPPEVAPESAEAVSTVDLLDECIVLEICVDHYLFALYERAAKVDTNKVFEWRKVTVKKKRKLVTIRKRFTRLVEENFTWKDPNAAEKAGKSMMEYVIGGIDRDFKLKVFQALRAAEKAGLAPGITSGFRDDYRQSIASGLKAASNRSFHGGSLRGGYGHGLAVDIVSVNGANKAQRWVATSSLWKWIDDNEKEFGVGRPYLNRDPPHIAPIDGEEYVSRRGPKTQVARAAEKKKSASPAAQHKREAAKTKDQKVVRVATAAKSAKQSAPARRATASALVQAAARKPDR